MHSILNWKLAKGPNYKTNKDKMYPYSEVPYLEEYNLLKIPTSNDLIDHIDYWGEGKTVTVYGVSGFTDCYNVNHSYQLVSNGTDKERKIPNRIPVTDYEDCDTSRYVKDNSVATVTVMGSPINESCAKDIARMVNKGVGKVVAYGYDSNSEYMQNLAAELMKIYLFYCPTYSLPKELQGLTIFDSYMAFVNLSFFDFRESATKALGF